MSYLGNASVVPNFQFINCNLMVVLQEETYCCINSEQKCDV